MSSQKNKSEMKQKVYYEERVSIIRKEEAGKTLYEKKITKYIVLKDIVSKDIKIIENIK